MFSIRDLEDGHYYTGDTRKGWTLLTTAARTWEAYADAARLFAVVTFPSTARIVDAPFTGPLSEPSNVYPIRYGSSVARGVITPDVMAAAS